MQTTKPLVAAALVCERVLRETDSVLSAIRVVDRLTAMVPPPQPQMRPAFDLTVFVSVKSGGLAGGFEMAVALRRPSGKTTPLGQWPVVFQGPGQEEEGANIIVRVGLVAEEWGLHWFDVSWDGGPLTSIPVRLVQTEGQPSEPTPESS